MMNKILLINPPIQDFYQTEIRQEPLGLEYLAGVLQKEGYEVYLLDALAHGSKKTIPLPAQLSYLKEFYPCHDLSPFKLFTRYQHFGLSSEMLQEELVRLNPDLVGISANFTPYFDLALMTARISKKILPRVPVVMGGHHVTAEPESALQSSNVDYVVLGEGERVFPELIKILTQRDWQKLRNLPGIAFKNGGQIQLNAPDQFIEDLDSLPYPLPHNPVSAKMVITSRGCPRRCNFCPIEKVMGKRLRFRSVPSVVGEIQAAVAQGIRHIDFEDDNLTYYKPRAVELFQALIKNFQGRGITFSARNGLDAETLDRELIGLMKEAGFEWLNIPLVSGSPEVQRALHRHQSEEKFLEIVRLANYYQLKVVAYLILGLPEDHLEQMLRDIIFLAGQKLLLGPSIFYPAPATPTYQNCLEKGYIPKGEYTLLRSSAFPVETEHFRRSELVTLVRLVRVINFLKRLIDQTLTRDENFYDYLNPRVSNFNELTFRYKLTPIEIGHLLLHQLFVQGELKGLRLKATVGGRDHYQWLEYVHCPILVQSFLRSLKGRRLPGVVKEYAFLF